MKPECCREKSKEKSQIARLEAYLKVLSEPNRLKILCLLKQGECCVCDIFAPLKLPQNLISHHLAALRGLGVINFRKKGARVIYFRNERKITYYQKLLKGIINL